MLYCCVYAPYTMEQLPLSLSLSLSLPHPLPLPLPLTSDIEKIQSGIGDKVAVFLSYFSTFITAYIIAFTRNWEMALVVMTMLPLIALVGGVISRVSRFPFSLSLSHTHTHTHIHTSLSLSLSLDHSHIHSQGAECLCIGWGRGRRGSLCHSNCRGFWRGK